MDDPYKIHKPKLSYTYWTEWTNKRMKDGTSKSSLPNFQRLPNAIKPGMMFLKIRLSQSLLNFPKQRILNDDITHITIIRVRTMIRLLDQEKKKRNTWLVKQLDATRIQTLTRWVSRHDWRSIDAITTGGERKREEEKVESSHVEIIWKYT